MKKRGLAATVGESRFWLRRRRFQPTGGAAFSRLFRRGALTCGGELVKMEKSANGGCAFVGFFF